MSDAAIYDVTKALRMLLHSQLGAGATVTLLPPGDMLPEVLGVNLYLYRVLESPYTKNRPWPGDKTTPPSDQPALGLQLFYLLTPLGAKPDDSSFQTGDDAHTMLGRAMLTLHEHPILNDIHIPGFDADTVLSPALLNSYEQVKVCLLPVGLEELSKIWASINRPYRLSVAYEVSLVELTPTPPPPVNGGIVTITNVNVITLDPPRLTVLSPASGALAHLVSNTVTPNTLQITGFGFSFPGQTPIVHVGGQIVKMNGVPAPTDQALTVTLPTDLDAGPQADVSITLNQRASMPLPFIVTPWLERLTPIRIALDPASASAQRKLALKGVGFTTTPQAVRFDASIGSASVNTFDPGGTDTSSTVTIPPTLVNGVYDVRIVLNDAASSLSNSRTLEVIPFLNSVDITVNGGVHQLTLNGARLNGNNIRLIIDDVIYQAGANANPAQFIYTLGRLLSVGSHTIAVNVDGHLSHSLDKVV